jgi:Asp-tRNA(Asn)/Glu-tRNA(Gln) amidotransferase A subunit family amidase
MQNIRRTGVALSLATLTLATAAAPVAAQVAAEFDVVEASMEDIHEAFRAGRLTARRLVELYLARIEAYDKQGPSLNSLIVLHPGALARAEELDREFARSGRLTGPLHGIPVIVKDNYDTFDLPTTAGSRALANSIPPDDAFLVKRIREAGAIVLAKSNMAEFAFSPVETVGSVLGYTFNPYALNRVPAGSSGGTAAAVAASFGTVGLGSDTGNSIRGPSSHTALVGIRPTIGLTSRDGIVPLYLERDVGGPMARTVADVARVLDVLAGMDPADAATAAAADRIPESYTAFLDPNALRGVRLGVLRRHSNRNGADPEVIQRFEEALRDLERLGATIVDPFDLMVMDSVRYTMCSSFKRDIGAYLATLGENAPVRTLEQIVESNRFHVTIEGRLRGFLDDGDAGEPERCRIAAESRARYQAGMRAEMQAQRLDAVIYPTWANPPRLIGDLTSPGGDNSQSPAPQAGFPAITVPMGWVRNGTLPVGLQILGDAWSEPRLIAFAFAYEQATKHRRPPTSTPPLPVGRD